ELLIVGLAIVATVALSFPSIRAPRLFFDDFAVFIDSWDAPTTLRNLWAPHNDHAMPLGRLLAWLLLHVDTAVDTLPLRAELQGPLAAGLAAGLIYMLVRREFGQPLPALAAAILYGVSLKYQETTHWYAASFWLLGFVTML